jgi:hypothetical protein
MDRVRWGVFKLKRNGEPYRQQISSDPRKDFAEDFAKYLSQFGDEYVVRRMIQADGRGKYIREDLVRRES